LVPGGHAFFGTTIIFFCSSIFFCGSMQRAPVQVQPFFLQSDAGFEGSTHVLPSLPRPNAAQNFQRQ